MEYDVCGNDDDDDDDDEDLCETINVIFSSDGYSLCHSATCWINENRRLLLS